MRYSEIEVMKLLKVEYLSLEDEVKFNILNYTKNDSLFNTGMKISVLTPNSKSWIK